MLHRFNSPFSVFRLLRCALLLTLTAAAGAAVAGEAGRIVFVTGDVKAGNKTAVLGEAVQEGAEIVTGKDGYIYLKTVDDGLLILRPASRARIDAYHIDSKDPANSRVKLELLSGVARSVSGKGVKAARQNFRFNTPVAAIGVRGTDFTVFTDQQTSNVTVLAGAIVVSGFGGSCAASGGGPCEHAASRELAAGQLGQMLQVRSGQTEPKLISAGTVAPDAVAPPRPDEPAAKSAASTPSASTGETSLDPLKADGLLQRIVQVNTTTPVAPADPVTPVTPVAPTTPEVPALPDSEIVWGRWAAVAGNSANISTTAQAAAGSQRVAMNQYYAIYRTQGADWQTPLQGSASFSMRQGEAVVQNDATGVISAATLENGKLQVDFAKASFTTSVDLLTGSERFNLRSSGSVARDGLLGGAATNGSTINMNINGTLGAHNDAAYLFYSRLDATRTANGITYWTK
jgi:hypothetical protein